jgi:hypothetical protein
MAWAPGLRKALELPWPFRARDLFGSAVDFFERSPVRTRIRRSMSSGLPTSATVCTLAPHFEHRLINLEAPFRSLRAQSF